GINIEMWEKSSIAYSKRKHRSSQPDWWEVYGISTRSARVVRLPPRAEVSCNKGFRGSIRLAAVETTARVHGRTPSCWKGARKVVVECVVVNPQPHGPDAHTGQRR